MPRSLQLLFTALGRDIGSKTVRMMSHSGNNPSRTNILAESWSTISSEYEEVLVPRFAPWTRDALDSLRNAVNGDMKYAFDGEDVTSRALVLCCGPGQELLPVAKITGGHVLGTDLASGMVDVAKRRIGAECREGGNAKYKEFISAEVGDAMDPPPGPYHVIFSAFGLQQLPMPVLAVEKWIDRMQPGGICAFIYWPPNPPKIPGEEEGPFEVWGDLVRMKLGNQKDDAPWDENIKAAIAEAGGEIICDRFIVHDISWKDSTDLFEGMSRAGPWHALRLRRGNDFVDELGQELQLVYPPGTPLRHKFTARLVIAKRGDEL